MSNFIITDEENRHFVWPHPNRHQHACCTRERSQRPVAPIIVPPIAQIPTPRVQPEKFSFKFGKVRVEVKNARQVEVQEDKATNTLTLTIKST
ncbi:MAG: hypothetical protein FWE31_01700 [Firmicutes bacterium]|nr:hypothetical protein [Bacillota bacterium]